jgi:hypothetical protein
MEELPQVAVRLEDAWTAAALHPLFCFVDKALQQGCEKKYAENLKNLESDIRQCHAVLRTENAAVFREGAFGITGIECAELKCFFMA